ncbi:hypothetical protein ACFO4N_02760 [Camelliibacillus cellulosilyticus]|uniref:Uncharacterized protein n=1 Tax=Camelliibacillus cellulosilyticus TaxID=2174486 RepID=A0ABV9GK83_9BACL
MVQNKINHSLDQTIEQKQKVDALMNHLNDTRRQDENKLKSMQDKRLALLESAT